MNHLLRLVFLTCAPGFLSSSLTANPPAIVPEKPLAPEPGSEAPSGPRTLEQMTFDEYAAELNRVLKSFANAENVEALLPLVRNRPAVEPLLRARYTEANPWKPPGMRRDVAQDGSVVTSGNLIVAGWEGADFSILTTSLEWTGKTFLVDWEAFTGYGEMTWAELVKNRPVTPVLMRVAMESGARADYFNEDFTDSAKFRCHTLRDITGDHFLSGYTVRGSDVDQRIQQHLKVVGQPGRGAGPGRADDPKRAYAIVRIQFRKDGQSTRQVEITEMVESGWSIKPQPPQPAPEK